MSFSNLECLDLANNRLENIPPEISKLSSLQFLDLSNNYLTHLPADLAELVNLKFLDLTRNRLMYLPSVHGMDLTIKRLRRSPLYSMNLGILYTMRTMMDYEI